MRVRSKPAPPLRRAAAWALLCVFGAALPGSPAVAAPSGEQVISGERVTFDRDGNTTTIRTDSELTIVEYQSFDILAGELVDIKQPNTTSRFMNKVPHGDPTPINGELRSNGIVYILNPAGVFFGNEAVVDVSGLVAGAGSLSDADFSAGIDRFTNLTGDVEVAKGASLAADSFVALVGRRVANFGAIRTESGMIALVAGENALLTKIDGRVVVRVDMGSAGATGSEDFALTQAGSLDAGSGRVSLTAGDSYSLAMNHNGITRGREIELHAQGDGLVQVAGVLDASATEAGETGGTIQVLGDRIALQGALLDASGDAGGGEIFVGGDVGGEGELPTARRTYVSADSALVADAIRSGEGGQIVVWSQEKTGFYGAASARGGELSGDGGFIEISGKRYLEARGEIALDAPNGASGTLLYDPESIEIVGGGPTDGADANQGSDDDLTLLGDGGVFGEILAGDVGDDSLPFVIYESEIEGTDANIVLQAENAIFVSGSFTNEVASEGQNVVVIMPGNDLTMETTGEGAENLGIDLTLDGADLTWQVSQGGTIFLTTGAGEVDSPIDGVAAPIRVGTLEFAGRGYVFDEEFGFSLPQPTDRTAVAVSTLQGNVEIGRIIANGDDATAEQLAGAAGGVVVTAQTGDITIGSIEANGGSAAGFVSGGGSGGAIVIDATNGGVVIEGVPRADDPDRRDGILASGGNGIAGTRGDQTLFSAGGGGGEIILSSGSLATVDLVGGVTVLGDVIATGGDGLGVIANEDGSFASPGGAGGRIEIGAVKKVSIGALDAPTTRLDVSAGSGSGAGGSPTIFVRGQFASLVDSIDIATPALSDGAVGEDNGSIELFNTALVGRGGDAGLAGGPGGSGGNGANVRILSASGSLEAPFATVDVGGGAGGFGQEGPAAVPGFGGAAGLVNVSGKLGASLGDVAAVGGFGDNGPGGPGGRLIVGSEDGDVRVQNIDVSGGNASEDIEALEGVSGGAGGSQVTLTTGDEDVDSDAGDVELAGVIRGFGGQGQDENGDPTYASGAFLTIDADGAVVALPGFGSRIDVGNALVIGATIGTAEEGIALGGTWADDDRATVSAEGSLEAVVFDEGEPMQALESLQIVQADVGAESRVVRSSDDFELLRVSGDTDARTQTVVGLKSDDTDPSLDFRFDETIPDGGPSPATVEIASGAVDLGIAGGGIANGSLGVGASNDGAIEGGAGGSHVASRGDFSLDGLTIGTEATPIEVSGAPEAVLRTVADGEIRVAVDVDGSPFGVYNVTQGDAAAGTRIQGPGELVMISGVGSQESPVSRVDVTTAEAGFVYHLVAPVTDDGVLPDIEVASLRIGGSGLLDAPGDIRIAAPGAGFDETILLGGGSELAFTAGGSVQVTDPGVEKISIAGTDPNDPANLVFDLGGSVGGPGSETLITGNVGEVAARITGGFHLTNTEGGDLTIGSLALHDPSDLDDPTSGVSITGIVSVDPAVVGDVEITNSAGKIVLGELPGSNASVHIASTGDVLLATPVEIDNAQFVSTVVDDGQGGLTVELLPRNEALIIAQGGIVIADIDSAADATAVDTRTEIDEADRLADAPAAGELLLSAQSGPVTFVGDVGMGLDGALAGLDTTSAQLAGDTRSFRAAELIFRGTLDGPARAVVVGTVPVGSDAEASQVSFGGDVGTRTALGGLDVVADQIRFSLAPEDGVGTADRVVIDGDVTLATNQVGTPPLATIVDASGGLSIESSGKFEVSPFEKISVTGPLTIAASEVRVADLSADRIRIESPQIDLLVREPALLELADGSEVTDQGLDFVANQIAFSSAPNLVGVGPAPTFVLGSGGLALPGSLADLRVRRFTPDLDAVSPGNFAGQNGVVLDLEGTGGAFVGDPARQLTRVEPLDLPQLPEQAGDQPPAAAPSVSASQVLAFLRCGRVDAVGARCSEAELAAVASLADVSGSALGTPRAQEITDRYRALMADPGAAARLRVLFAEAGRAYAAAREWNDGDVDGADLYRFLVASQAAGLPALDAVNALAWLFVEIDLLGLADPDTRRLQATLAQDFAEAAALPGFTPEEVVAAVAQSPAQLP